LHQVCNRLVSTQNNTRRKSAVVAQAGTAESVQVIASVDFEMFRHEHVVDPALPAPPADDPPKWWHATKITSFEVFITMAKETAPDSAVRILRRGETYTFEVPESRR
jgi:hypothetical protein